jgi:hypothetical protein
VVLGASEGGSQGPAVEGERSALTPALSRERERER